MNDYLSSSVSRYKVIFINGTNINPLWEGYATSEMEAKIKATLWVKRVYIPLNISEVICERIEEVRGDAS